MAVHKSGKLATPMPNHLELERAPGKFARALIGLMFLVTSVSIRDILHLQFDALYLLRRGLSFSISSACSVTPSSFDVVSWPRRNRRLRSGRKQRLIIFGTAECARLRANISLLCVLDNATFLRCCRRVFKTARAMNTI
jgi:hypothetical protein